MDEKILTVYGIFPTAFFKMQKTTPPASTRCAIHKYIDRYDLFRDT